MQHLVLIVFLLVAGLSVVQASEAVNGGARFLYPIPGRHVFNLHDSMNITYVSEWTNGVNLSVSCEGSSGNVVEFVGPGLFCSGCTFAVHPIPFFCHQESV
jgi:hypothetical protein